MQWDTAVNPNHGRISCTATEQSTGAAGPPIHFNPPLYSSIYTKQTKKYIQNETFRRLTRDVAFLFSTFQARCGDN